MPSAWIYSTMKLIKHKKLKKKKKKETNPQPGFELISLWLKGQNSSGHFHDGESSDILKVYSDRTYKKIDHYFFNTQ